MKHYECAPTAWQGDPLIFDWDEETGVVSGPSADVIKALAAKSGIAAHPIPWHWEFSAVPLKSRTDMAAIIGWQHRLPDDLAPFYPAPPSIDELSIQVIY